MRSGGFIEHLTRRLAFLRLQVCFSISFTSLFSHILTSPLPQFFVFRPSDFGAMAVADACPNLKYLNIAGLSRISDVGARALCAKCWYLETLNVEDVFLLGDESFRYSFAYDGRVGIGRVFFPGALFVSPFPYNIVTLSQHQLQTNTCCATWSS